MKSKTAFGQFISLIFIAISILSGLESFAQEEIAQASIQNDKLILVIPKASLKQTVIDTVLPTLCNSGRGLMHIESISLPETGNDYSYNIKGNGITTASKDGAFTEEEIKALREQKRLMEEQYLLEWQQQSKMERYYFDLEGIIRGVSTPPLF
jgi:hypothetical protein